MIGGGDDILRGESFGMRKTQQGDIQNDGFGNGFHMARITRGLPQVKRVNQVVFVRAQKLLLEQWSQDIPAGFSMCNKI